uniref:Uncharacterized protein n=1 Tax=Parastrongyloides trichosuri TaxID=131310 RepID=A0A0N4ZJ54_PARTI
MKTFILIFVAIVFQIINGDNQKLPADISQLIKNNQQYISRIPATSSFGEMRNPNNKFYSFPRCYYYFNRNGDWNNGNFDTVTCNYNSMDKCISIVGKLERENYIYLGCASAVLLSEGYDPNAFYIDNGCKNDYITTNDGDSGYATVCACSHDFCNTENYYTGSGNSIYFTTYTIITSIIFLLVSLFL